MVLNFFCILDTRFERSACLLVGDFLGGPFRSYRIVCVPRRGTSFGSSLLKYILTCYINLPLGRNLWVWHLNNAHESFNRMQVDSWLSYVPFSPELNSLNNRICNSSASEINDIYSVEPLIPRAFAAIWSAQPWIGYRKLPLEVPWIRIA